MDSEGLRTCHDDDIKNQIKFQLNNLRRCQMTCYATLVLEF